MIDFKQPMAADISPAPQTPDGYAIRGTHWLLLGVILVAACFLRFLWIDATAVWCDELLSIHISNAHGFSVDALPRNELLTDVPDLMALQHAQPWWKVWGSMGGDMHPPLYYGTLRLWRELFGDSPTGIRSLSAILGTLAVAAMFFAGRELCGTIGGLWIALLNALAAHHIYYSQEARMYVMTLLWVSLAFFLVLRIERCGFTKRRATGLAAVSLLAMLTLYMSAAVLIACGLYVLIRFRGRARNGTVVAFVLAAVAWSILWLPFMLGQHFHALKSDWLKVDDIGFVSVIEQVARLPMRQFGGVVRRSMEPAAYVFSIVYLLPLLALRRRPAVLLPCLASMLIVAIPAVTDYFRSTNMLDWTRYTVTLIPALSLGFVATSIELFRTRSTWIRFAAPAVLTLFTLLSLIPLYTEMPRYDYRAYARFAERANQQTGGRLIFASTLNFKFNSVLLLAMQYYWSTPPRELVFVESVDDINRLPAEWLTDPVILCAGDLAADLTQLNGFDPATQSTWELGVGTVHVVRRADPVSTTPTTMPAAPTTSSAAPAIEVAP